MYYSFIMLKPDALERNLVKELVERLKVLDLKIEVFDVRLVNEEIIFSHYNEVINKVGEVFKEMATKSFVNKYVIPMIVSSNDPDIINNVRLVIGATDPSKAPIGTIRGDLGIDYMEKSFAEKRCCNNLIHASDSYESYLYESGLWFGHEISSKYQ